MIGAVPDPQSGVEAHLESTPTTAFGKYQLFASLGRGGMADVFLSVARGQMGFNKLAVIKRLRQALAEERAFRTMFLDEARLAARLSHPNIVHTYEVGEQNGVYFIAMEYLDGQSLNKVLKEALRRDERIDWEIGVRIVSDALSGLAYAHDLRDYDGRPLGIIHRDISPHNIFVTYDGHTKLVDFGIAKAALSSTETEVGVLKGKVAYMSPEQAMGGLLDRRADVFAMGIVLWEVLTQQRLMTGETAAHTLHKLINEPIPRVSTAAPGIDPQLEIIVMKALEKDPHQRWQSASEMRDALESWLRSNPRAVRQEDVGKKMQGLFANIREEVQRQVQRHMAALTLASTTQELQALTQESLQRMEQSGANVSGQLLHLGSGSGSGVVPSLGTNPTNHGSGSMVGNYSTSGTPPAPAPHARAKNTMLIVLSVAVFLLTGVIVVFFGMKERARLEALFPARAPAPTASSPPIPSVEIIQPNPIPSVTPFDTAAPPVTSPAPTAPPVQTNTRPPPRAPAPPPVRPPPVPHAAPPPPATPAAPVVEEKEPGYLTINVYPWAKVSEGGRVLCAATPCNKIPLSPGTHTLVLENSEQGMRQTTTVTIKSGETTARAIGFK